MKDPIKMSFMIVEELLHHTVYKSLEVTRFLNIALIKRLLSWVKGVFILVIMKRLIYDWFLAIVAIFLLLTTTDQVEDEKDIEVRYWPHHVKLLMPTSNDFFSVANVMGSAERAPTCSPPTPGSLPTTLTASKSAWTTLTRTSPWQNVASSRMITPTRETATSSPTAPNLMDLA